MNCAMCKHGQTAPGLVTVTLQRGGTTVVVKDVPADICDNCGEYYLSEAMTSKVMSVAEDAAAKNAEVEIIRFAA
jgi:YgiT-type zinc finger domain-containing protein